MNGKGTVFLNTFYRNKRWIFFILVILVAMLPLVVRQEYYLNVIVLTFFFAALSSAWNIVGGYAGQFSVGHATFFGIGAYTSTILFLNLQISPWIGMLVGGVFAAIFGAFIGWPCFRLRGPYFVLATIAISEIMRLLASHFKELTNGSVGLMLPSYASPQDFLFADRIWYAYVAFVFMMVMILVSYKIERSKMGYYLVALREDQDAAESLGIFASRYKLYAMMISSFFTGLAGTFYAQYFLFIDPDISFSIDISVEMVLMAIIGGSGTVLGPVLGAMILIPLDDFLRDLIGMAYSGLSFIIYGGVLMVVVILLPQGLFNLIRSKVEGAIKGTARRDLSVDSTYRADRGLLLQPKSAPFADDLIIAVENVNKSFGGLQAIQALSFQVKSGETLGIIGPNGAGKTTLFNLINGFLKPDSGRIRYKGSDITGLSPPEVCLKGIGRTFQLVKPFPKMTVLENVMVGCLARRGLNSFAEIEDLAEQILALIGLLEFKNFLAENLTLAHRKHLELARVIATGSDVILLDEVMAGLNPKETVDMIRIIQTISGRGVTLLVIEHVMKAIMSLSDRIIVLHHGEKISEGSPSEVVNDQRVVDAYLGKSKPTT